jgi:hypothetical protein
MDADVIIESLTYLFEIIINGMMIPGQVENWIFIMDLQHMGLTSLPINVFYNICKDNCLGSEEGNGLSST